MRKFGLCLFYGLCLFTTAFSLFWMALPRLPLPEAPADETPPIDVYKRQVPGMGFRLESTSSSTLYFFASSTLRLFSTCAPRDAVPASRQR